MMMMLFYDYGSFIEIEIHSSSLNLPRNVFVIVVTVITAIAIVYFLCAFLVGDRPTVDVVDGAVPNADVRAGAVEVRFACRFLAVVDVAGCALAASTTRRICALTDSSVRLRCSIVLRLGRPLDDRIGGSKNLVVALVLRMSTASTSSRSVGRRPRVAGIAIGAGLEDGGPRAATDGGSRTRADGDG